MGEEAEVAEEMLTSESVLLIPIHSNTLLAYPSAMQGPKGVRSISEAPVYGAPSY